MHSGRKEMPVCGHLKQRYPVSIRRISKVANFEKETIILQKTANQYHANPASAIKERQCIHALF